MKKLLPLSAALAVTVALTGCETQQQQQVAVAAPVYDCVFPDAPNTPAPGWICDEPVEGVEVSAVGSSQHSAAGHSHMKQMAATDARVQLAQRMKVHVQNMVKQYVETTGAGDTETVDRVMTSVTKQITDESLVGSRVYKSRKSPSGTLYVLVGLDDMQAEKAAKEALKTSMKNERALWQQFKAQKGHDELANEIAKYREMNQ
jgi:ribosomal protein S20